LEKSELPKVIGPITPDRWEQEVRRQMTEQLPKDWVILCNVSWVARTQGGYVRDGQADFVVLAPNLGMLIVEVKGSREIRVGEDGLWYRKIYTQRGKPESREVRLDESPPDQASRNMHELSRLASDQMHLRAFPGAYGFLVIYPNGEVNFHTTLIDKTSIITRREMFELERRFRATLVSRGSDSTGHLFRPEVCEKTAQVLAKIGLKITSFDTEHEVTDDENAIERLTGQQYAALKGIFDFRRVAVIGPAGAGKTVLAIWRLRSLRQEKKKALYVCFNKALAEFLRLKNPDVSDSIVNVDQLFFGLIKPKLPLVIPDNFFDEVLPNTVFDRSGTFPEDQKYQALVVDEGQDFGEYRLYALYQLLREGDSHWLFFADWTQDVYQKKFEIPLGAEVVFRLYHNCRNTELVNTATNRICEMNVMSMPESPKGEAPIVEYCKTDEITAARAFQIISEVSDGRGSVILSPYKIKKSCMSKLSRTHGLALTEDIENLNTAGCVLFSTIRAFKGLEASVVVIVDVTAIDNGRETSLEELYVACTRARSRLFILTTNLASCVWLKKKLEQMGG
jgi:hypothetical protein